MIVDASVVVVLTLANETIGAMGVKARRAVDVFGEGDAAVPRQLARRHGHDATRFGSAAMAIRAGVRVLVCSRPGKFCVGAHVGIADEAVMMPSVASKPFSG